jgi:tetratricopeptide (TPR) repeat protein
MSLGSFRHCLFGLAAMLLPPPGAAAPYVPASADTPLQTVVPAGEPVEAELGRLRAALDAAPGDPVLAARYARLAIERGRVLGDPRYYGRADAGLAYWRDAARVPPAIRVLRATLLQQRHAFSEALAELDLALADEPRNAQALLTRATIHQVQGRLPEALADCRALAGRVAPAFALLCTASVDAIGGRATRALEVAAHVAATERNAATRLWALTLQAETFARLGRNSEAERAFEAALAAMRADRTTDFYLLAARADFLLDTGRPAKVAEFLKPYPATDGLLLRQARATRAPALRSQLAQRFATSRERGDAPHAREEAWFALHVEDDPARALALARANWAGQREPADARLLLQAALRAGDRTAARPVLRWMSDTGIEDIKLETLRDRIEAVR